MRKTRIKKTNTLKKHARIRDAYQALCQKKEKGRRIYSDEYILGELSDQFLLSERYIDDIIHYRV